MLRFMLAVSLLLPIGANAWAEYQLDGEILKSMDGALTELTSTLDAIKPSEISIEYQEGKMIEDYVRSSRRLLAAIGDARRASNQRGHLADSARLLLHLKDLDANISELGSIVSFPITVREKKDVKQTTEWMKLIVGSRNSLSRLISQLEAAVLRDIADADTRLAKCDSSRE